MQKSSGWAPRSSEGPCCIISSYVFDMCTFSLSSRSFSYTNHPHTNSDNTSTICMHLCFSSLQHYLCMFAHLNLKNLQLFKSQTKLIDDHPPYHHLANSSRVLRAYVAQRGALKWLDHHLTPHLRSSMVGRVARNTWCVCSQNPLIHRHVQRKMASHCDTTWRAHSGSRSLNEFQWSISLQKSFKEETINILYMKYDWGFIRDENDPF